VPAFPLDGATGLLELDLHLTRATDSCGSGGSGGSAPGGGFEVDVEVLDDCGRSGGDDDAPAAPLAATTIRGSFRQGAAASTVAGAALLLDRAVSGDKWDTHSNANHALQQI